MDSLGGFWDPSASSSRSGTPTPASSSAAAAASSTSTATPTDTAQQAEGGPLAGIDKEVATVMSGLGSFWGKVRKQGQTALQNAEAQYSKAQKDLTPLLSQARTQLDQISTQTKAELARLSEQATPQPGSGVMIGADGMPVILDEVPHAPPAAKEDKGKGVDRGAEGEPSAVDDASTAAAHEQTPAAAASAFFRSLSTAAQPQLQSLGRDFSSLQSNLQSNLTHLQDQFSHLDLQSELSQTQRLAEGYLHKGESWFAEFSAEVGKLAKDAVRVVPPSAGGSVAAGAANRSAKAGQSTLSRRELLLFKLRSDPALLAADPAAPDASPSTREAFAAFTAALQSTRDGFDTPAFAERVEAELQEGGEALQRTRQRLTAGGEGQEGMSDEAFWGRYFFRKDEIEREEERRRRVLQVDTQTPSDDDFSWDMDDEESAASVASPPPSVAPTPSSAAPLPSAQPASPPSPPAVSAPAPAAPASPPRPAAQGAEEPSPRASSDTTSGSYDVVGETSGNPSASEGEEDARVAGGAVSPASGPAAGAGKKVEVKEEKEEDSEESDWE
ncbi:hypothetical protein JCM10207_009267 [Rhodosporidiobolus poonsookiae]